MDIVDMNKIFKSTIFIRYLILNMKSSSLRDTPKNDEDWIHLLQQQESLHNVEMRRWQRLLHNAAKLLKDVCS